MNQIASPGQLRMSFVRWAVFTVPLIVLLGFLSGTSVANGPDSRWYSALVKPPLTPPGWVFPVAWTVLYILIGVALAIIMNARGARSRMAAVSLFVLQFVLNLAWTPLFFGAHRIGAASMLIFAMLLIAIAATLLFGRIRPLAAWLMVPYLVWLSFAGVLNWRIVQLNPAARTLAPGGTTTQIIGR